MLNTGARTQTAFRSQHLNVPSLLAQQPLPLVHMHPSDAGPRGIVDGDPVVVTSPRGSVRYWAAVSEDIVPGTVGGGGPLGPTEWQEADINRLTDPGNCDPLSGFPVFKALLYEVTRRSLSSAEDADDENLARSAQDF